MQNSERGKKIGNAMMTTSRSVVQTGKAVGKAAAQLNPDQTVTSQHVIKVQTLSFNSAFSLSPKEMTVQVK